MFVYVFVCTYMYVECMYGIVCTYMYACMHVCMSACTCMSSHSVFVCLFTCSVYYQCTHDYTCITHSFTGTGIVLGQVFVSTDISELHT